MADYIKKANEKMMDCIHKLRENPTAEVQAEMMAEMANNGQFILPVKVVGASAEGRKLTFAITTDKKNQHFFIIFSDKDKLKAWSQGNKTESVVYDFQECGELAVGDNRISGFVLNPGTDNMLIMRKMIEDLMQLSRGAKYDMAPQAVNKDEDVTFRPVSIDAVKPMVRAMKSYMQQDANVAEAYIREMTRNGEDAYVVIIRHIGHTEPTFANVARAASDYLGNKKLAILSADSTIAEKAIADEAPFYRKPFSVVQ